MESSPLKLNLGCGSTKLPGYVNIDCEKKCKPDLIHNFIKKALPYENGSVDEIIMFHTIEHISKRFHKSILEECWRVLKSGGQFYLSYPNFWECACRWRENFQGKREFWHATMFGRQLYPSDYHVVAMDPTELQILLIECGFHQIKHIKERKENYNVITYSIKGEKTLVKYEDLLREDMVGMLLK